VVTKDLREQIGRTIAAIDSSDHGGDGHSDVDHLSSGRAYLRAMGQEGWAVPAWPKRFGGRDADNAEAAAIRAAMRGMQVPDLYPFFVGLRMVGPTLLSYGTPEQQARWLPRIATGEDVWCQMFSEPEAGSDLANVAMRAVQDGQTWCLSGQKIWTSRGAYAAWAICLARTDPSKPKHAGLTMFVVDMSAPGVHVRPLVQMNGDDHFSEVFVDNVLIDDANRIGEVGDGWKLALAVLGFERSSIGELSGSTGGAGEKGRIPNWLRELGELGVLANPVTRDFAMKAYSQSQINRWTSARAAAAARGGRGAGPEGSGHKLRTSAFFKQRAYLIKNAFGAHGMLTEHYGHDDFLTAPSMSLRGGTDEIQRNIVGERVLGLPTDSRSDKDVPWSKSRLGQT
jgi:alkylation response protein AidB-like acyl-CoA dehydrogenase